MYPPPPLERSSNRLRAGFTLVEIAIVLVIIGLIIGGILVGADMIQAATIRSQISQIDRINLAANTFKTKYGFLPGDMPADAAAQYGFAARGTGIGGQGDGDGNGVIESWNGGTVFGTYLAQGETIKFWTDLTSAGLMSDGGGFSTPTGIPGPGNATGSSTPSLDVFFPHAKTGGWIVVYSIYGVNYLGLETLSIQPNGPAFGTPSLKAPQAFAVDTKIDDGAPQNGSVTAQVLWNTAAQWVAGGNIGYGLYKGADPGTSASPGNQVCYNNASTATNPMQYSIAGSGSTGLNCGLQIRAGF